MTFPFFKKAKSDTISSLTYEAQQLARKIGLKGYSEESKLLSDILQSIQEQESARSEYGPRDGSPTFKYIALDTNGSELKGVVEAESQPDAIVKIRAMGYFPTRVTQTP